METTKNPHYGTRAVGLFCSVTYGRRLAAPTAPRRQIHHPRRTPHAIEVANSSLMI